LTPASRIYRLAAAALTPLLRTESVRSVYVRRSVAVGEARFPWSDLDLGLILNDSSGQNLSRLWRRYRIARAVFPRLEECQIFTAAEFAGLAASDPYRASLDRRFALTVAGESPEIPTAPIGPRSAARRLVFWFVHYLPLAVRRGRLRDQQKVAEEMWNAFGVLEGAWPEPLPTRREAVIAAAALGIDAEEYSLQNSFAACCKLAARAAERLDLAAPSLTEPAILISSSPIVLLPDETTPWPAFAMKNPAAVFTPAALQLTLETHEPLLWLPHGKILADMGFAPPSAQSWAEACVRHTRADNPRSPGFMGKKPETIQANLNLVARILPDLEQGRAIEGPLLREAVPQFPSVTAFYRDGYDSLAEQARELNQRATRLLGK